MDFYKGMRMLLIDEDNNLGNKLRKQYENEKPFPHIVIDNFVGEDILKEAIENFPTAKELDWIKYNNPLEKKIIYCSSELLHDSLKNIIQSLNSIRFIKFLEDLTGFKNIKADENLTGGGLHQVQRGGKLDIHADFNMLYGTAKKRCINAILYLNENWQENYGGHLELWPEDMSECQAKILPIFNRLVIFNTNETSYHGHPDPLECPEDWTRKSIALYYYIEENKKEGRSTKYMKRPGDPDNEELDYFREQRSIPKDKRKESIKIK
jgi:Rps23 Pro-64 3,4-dihydroxylase Tpa1-like proline 4-hydroxylase